ncbi:hypothetical protein [Micromonospora yangpuensis]|uniref:hypothetical protein n=1 Tax=Micromonospora yangpuensis TaxID=683228 RepID=UPI0015862776|nr:hypothetical protein [Micromonospora yangpuensis]
MAVGDPSGDDCGVCAGVEGCAVAVESVGAGGEVLPGCGDALLTARGRAWLPFQMLAAAHTYGLLLNLWFWPPWFWPPAGPRSTPR